MIVPFLNEGDPSVPLSTPRYWNHSRFSLMILWKIFKNISYWWSIGKSEYKYVYVFTNNLCVIVSLKINCIWPNNVFLNITKASKEHTRVSSRRLLQEVHGLINSCTFALADDLAGRFIFCFWVSLIGVGLRPSRELVWHLSTQLNNGLLAV